jgi:hypothetical protein
MAERRTRDKGNATQSNVESTGHEDKEKAEEVIIEECEKEYDEEMKRIQG